MAEMIGGGGGGSDNGGLDGDVQRMSSDREAVHRPKGKILTGFLLLVVLMTFGGLIAAYVVIATNGVAEWQPFRTARPSLDQHCDYYREQLAYHFGKKLV